VSERNQIRENAR